jgi:hypothetical protein
MSEIPNRDDDEGPRKSLLATLPRGVFTRVFVLLALLAGVVVLQRRAGSIAGCMNQTFMLPQPRASRATPSNDSASARGPVRRVQVQLPESARR